MRLPWRGYEPFLVLTISLAFGLLYTLLTPPFATPDETGHWLHAAAIAHGGTWRQTPNATVPAWTRPFIDSYAPGGDISQISAAPRFDVAVTGETTTVQLHNVSTYNAVAYAPAAAGIAVARAAGLSALSTFRAGRIATTIVCSLLIALGIACAGSGRALLSLVSLSPMAVALRGSYSPDALLLAAAVVIIGALNSPSGGRMSLRRATVAFLAALVVILIKPPYLPVAALASCAALALPRSRRTRLMLAGAVVAVLTLTAAMTAASSREVSHQTVFRFDAVVNASAQLHYIQEKPLQVTTLLVNDLATNALRYARESIGVLGWLNVPLPRSVYWFYSAAFLLALLCRRWSDTAVPVPLSVATVVATPFVLALAVYVAWTPVGADHLDGFQGRYLLPVLPCLALLPPVWRHESWKWNVVAIAFASVVLTIALRAVVQHYGAA